ncbi:Pyruvate/2-oxoglutarate dehydrogenase complex, dihydrolipoamide dehydrogenase (E3) component [Modicisalibacter ilicicola DSM 19980]|uniref:Pyruvate/2-oxoglutarate dehydrogenase complex, dihydrolipoamide dehydrogenase (E3) component n=1 Tax=Modicisalibacter ilicicola DSM 19980 TaxID=1121942 RepID=A0A1M4Y7V2_9GAMM|nr:bifunctional TVP38/TMEM64 family protein/FAD-dependent oxidoreductase [Halomonas ilicicola]SHF01894.1 Pyruvate/2-oxoglutarate dehydrogenase complex, dihydrolipoamide dehydrogenase (E3) component [Halomonas ilicicola DSM 19980]
MNRKRLIVLAVVAIAIILFFASGANDALTLDNIKHQQARFQSWFAADPGLVAGGFFTLYVAMAAFSLPGAALLTLLAGALFGLGWGMLIVSFASTIGATLAFLIARLVAQRPLEKRFSRQLASINRGIEREGAFYLFTLRLVPIFPFFIINLVMGLTRMRPWTFYWVSQLGMLPGTLVYVNAGRELGELESLGGILSPGLIASFVLIGIFPLLARWLVEFAKRRRVARRFSRPQGFDYDIVVIGAGSAGLVASYIAAALKSRVALIERERMGGDCLNTGCVPSKALIRASRIAQTVREGKRFGIDADEPRIDFTRVMEHVHRAIDDVAPHDSRERYESLGVEVIAGEAWLQTPWEVRVDDRVLTTRHVIIASGARPRVPELPGLDSIDVLTSDNLWQLDALPGRLLILGGGPIGCELGQAFARLGSRVTIVQHATQLLPREDADIAEVLVQQMREEGIDVRLGTTASGIEPGPSHGDDGKVLVVERDGLTERLVFDRLLVAVGREANVAGLGLEALGIDTNARGTLNVDGTLRSLYPNIWACGDVAGPYQLTHASAHQAWHATVNALFGGIKRFTVDYRNLPAVTFTQPEVARVGLNERDARAQGVAFETTRYDFSELDRAIAEGETVGFIKVLTVPGKDRILGASIIGDHAGELLAEFTLAMTQGIGLNKLLGTIHPYPTFSEAAKGSAGAWKNAHKPERVLGWLERYFAWRRRGRSRA